MSSHAATNKPKKFQRNQTLEQKQIQAQKYSATMAKKTAAKEAAELQIIRRKEENKRVNFFSGHKPKAAGDRSNNITNLNIHVNETSDEGFANLPTTSSMCVHPCDDNVLLVDSSPLPTKLHTADILNNLDFNDEDKNCLDRDSDDDYDGDEK